MQNPYDCLQDDILQFQGTGAEVPICGDMNARTAEKMTLSSSQSYQSAWMYQMKLKTCHQSF